MTGPAAGGPPFVDEHSVFVVAPATAVWAVLVAPPRRRPGGALLTRALRLSDPDAARPGFAVAESDPPRRLLFAGGHRFSDYTLEWRLSARDGGTVLAARTCAAFPGWRGRVYRALVIGSGGHRVVMRRWLRAIRAQAERGPAERSASDD
ncbi:hypothetical protein I6A60_22160 [Frankia sp. AgB1.9]|uniref:hypothetical protein n=1 Tax=unclassified Frankia TaxID=2632575 RepID=UPI001933B6FF|nr:MULTISPECIES: hypothetical protein [unclassified Frankia]MBL7492918.1 hypothetical protein [Frankia sp. AgW1.1]MBL7550554.1 hypothetical protein [Frankia sp. AgB1.9]MBL7624930.1 hypothetical protein [Frankia sp. AgB1.8]